MICHELYTIGEISKLCNISKKRLRYYDEIGLLCPDEIKGNGYRYYRKESFLEVPILKYYQQLGFRLNEINSIIRDPSLFNHEIHFQLKIVELEEKQKEIENCLTALKDWSELVREGKLILSTNPTEPTIKYLSQETFCCLKQEFTHNYLEHIVNVPWVNHLENNQNEITGPVLLKFDSVEKRKQNIINDVTIVQKNLKPCNDNLTQTTIECCMMASIYCIGNLDNLTQCYQQLTEWLDNKNYCYGPECYERFIIDYWTSRDSNDFVTEILIPITACDIS